MSIAVTICSYKSFIQRCSDMEMKQKYNKLNNRQRILQIDRKSAKIFFTNFTLARIETNHDPLNPYSHVLISLN